MRSYIILVVAALAGCAYVPPRADYDAMANTYRSVRSGTQLRADADRIRFCAAGDSVEAARTWREGVDNWIDEIRDDQITDGVRSVLSSDAALRGEDIRARVEKGEVFLTGNVRSDATAMRAARDVIGVAGVIAVDIQLMSSEAPGGIRIGRADVSCL